MDLPGRLRYRCSVPSCSNAYYSDIKIPNYKNRRFFTLPQEHSLRSQWLSAVNLDLADFKKKTYYVCDAHFENKCFTNSLRTRLHNKKWAIPSLNLSTVNGNNGGDVLNNNSVKEESRTTFEASSLESNLKEVNLEIKTEPEEEEELPESYWTNPRFNSLQGYIGDKNCLTSVCRICFQAIMNHSSQILTRQGANSNIDIQSKVKFVLPNIDLDVFSNSVICNKCVDLVNSSIELQEKWLLAQERFQQIIDKRRDDRIRGDDILIVVQTNIEESQPRQIELEQQNLVQIEQEPAILLENESVNENENERDHCKMNHQQTYVSTIKSKKKMKHKKITEAKNIICSICRQTLPNVSAYINHSYKHPELRNKCYRCNEQLENKRRFHIHLKGCRKKLQNISSSSKNKKYLCQICKKEFLFSWYLENHLKFCK